MSNLPGPDEGAGLLDLLQQFKTFAGGVIAIGVYRGIRMFLRSLNEKTENTKADQKAKDQWLSDRDRRVRDVADRTDADNTKLRDRLDDLENTLVEKDHEIERERQSGAAHYLKTIRIYAYAGQLVHDWRNGREPPKEMTKIEDL